MHAEDLSDVELVATNNSMCRYVAILRRQSVQTGIVQHLWQLPEKNMTNKHATAQPARTAQRDQKLALA